MFQFGRNRITPGKRAIPAGERIYAIGDIHGRLDLLDAMIERIAQDRPSPAVRTTLIFLGDLVDRGPQSREVVERVHGLSDTVACRLLKGNHEEIFVEAARGDVTSVRALIKMGGLATLHSYGIDEHEAGAGTFADLARLMIERVPREHVRFLDAAEDMIIIGDYAFVHAGIRPLRKLDKQTTRDLRWIRDSFTASEIEHGPMIVHGHTITEEIEVRPNRIGLDTGAFRSGVLSAMGLEGTDQWFLTVNGPPAEA